MLVSHIDKENVFKDTAPVFFFLNYHALHNCQVTGIASK